MYEFGAEELEAVKKVITSGHLYRYELGDLSESSRFEQEWSDLHGCAHAIAVSSGTADLICGLVGMEIGPGDEVIIPAYTFMATALAVLMVGAEPVVAEIDETLTIDPEDVVRKISGRTRAVVPVHMCGLACDMDAIMDIASKHDLLVLEDACQAAGGSYRTKPLGTVGHAGSFSFNKYKIVTSGEGGALVTGERDIYEHALVHHDGGCVNWDHSLDLRVPIAAGSNYRISEMQSAMLRVQTRRLGAIVERLRLEKQALRDRLGGIGGFVFHPANDVEGDCGTNLTLLFYSETAARGFFESLSQEHLIARRPLAAGRHVVVDWEPIVERRGANHPGRDAFLQSARAPSAMGVQQYPRTISILGRTVTIDTTGNRGAPEIEAAVRDIKRALWKGAALGE